MTTIILTFLNLLKDRNMVDAILNYSKEIKPQTDVINQKKDAFTSTIYSETAGYLSIYLPDYLFPVLIID